MTLLVGAVFPWPELADRLPAFGIARRLGNPAGIIIAADSRWTYPDAHHEDGAAKVFGLGNNGIMGYSGPAGIGENVLIGLSQKLRRTSSKKEFAEECSRLILEATGGDLVDGLEILVGFSEPAGDAYLFRFSFADDFSGVDATFEVIGADISSRYFRQALTSHLIDVGGTLKKGQSINLDMTSWGTLFAAIINEIGEFGIDVKVGGAVMCATTTRGNSRGWGVTRVSKGGPDGFIVDEIGLQGGGKTVRDGWEYTPTPGTED